MKKYLFFIPNYILQVFKLLVLKEEMAKKMGN